MLGSKRYCYPLTVTDHASRYLLVCEAMDFDQEQFAFTAFERLFKERGLPIVAWAGLHQCAPLRFGSSLSSGSCF